MAIKIAENLLENAHEFTKRAAEDLGKKDYKFSLIHFCSDIEQILKARLILEHWMLIIDKNGIDSAKQDDFNKGLLKTIPIDSVLQRSANLFDNVDKPYIKRIKELFNERNKVIHFYSSKVTQKEEQLQIVQLIHRAWYLTHKIIDTTKQLEHYKKKFNLIDEEMKRFDDYLGVIFDENEEVIEQIEREGNDMTYCEGCGFPSFHGSKSDDFIKSGRCITCGHKEYYLKIYCDSCHEANYLFHSNLINLKFNCSNETCESELPWNCDEVGDISGDPKHGSEYASCSECEHQYCVGFIGNTIICDNCLCEHDALHQCEFCGENITEYKENSYLSGCGFCDGRIGYVGLS